MPNPDELAELALTCARDAVDRLIALIGPAEPWADGANAPELALIELTRRDEDNQPKRAAWEGHSALDLLMAAREVFAPTDRSEPDA
jgi:hypothetical protein